MDFYKLNKCVQMIVSSMLLVLSAVTAFADSTNVDADSIDVVALTYEIEQEVLVTDSGMGTHRPRPRIDTTMMVLSPDRFLVEICNQSGCKSYVYNEKARTMSVFDWRGEYSIMYMDSVASIDDSLDRLQIDKKVEYILALRQRLTDGMGGILAYMTGWEEKVIFDTLREIPVSATEKKRIEAARLEQADTSNAAKRKRRGRQRPDIKENSTERPIDPTLLLSPEERERLSSNLWLRYALSRDGGLGTRRIKKSSLGEFSYTIDSTHLTRKIHGSEIDQFDWNWTSDLYSV